MRQRVLSGRLVTLTRAWNALILEHRGERALAVLAAGGGQQREVGATAGRSVGGYLDIEILLIGSRARSWKVPADVKTSHDATAAARLGRRLLRHPDRSDTVAVRVVMVAIDFCVSAQRNNHKNL
jgi:hypothetical protein